MRFDESQEIQRPERPASIEPPFGLPTLGAVLRGHAVARPEAVAVRFIRTKSDVDAIEAAALDKRVDDVSAWLSSRFKEADRVLLAFKSGLDFVVAFLACNRAGLIAAPVVLPAPREGMRRLAAIAADCSPAAVLTHGEALPSLDAGALTCPVLDIAAAQPQDSREAPARHCGIALLQYTSGSTGTPKGVVVTNDQLLSNIEILRRRFEFTTADSIVSWLPHYHDMGLIGGILTPLVCGYPTNLMSPDQFLRNPLSWLEYSTKYDATVLTAPTFAYDLCARRLRDRPGSQDSVGIDLSKVRTAIVGAEMVRADILKRFQDAMAPHGFSGRAFYPSYGLAECTLFVDGVRGPVERVARGFDSDALAAGKAVARTISDARDGQTTLVASGEAVRHDGITVAIVKPGASSPVQDGRVGEILVAGPSVASGYWQRPEDNKTVFQVAVEGFPDAAFVRTGDLGFFHNGSLFVVGRCDDLIIVNGVNYYPHDIEELSATSHPDAEGRKAAAIPVDENGETHLVVLQEVKRKSYSASDRLAIVAGIRQAVHDHCGLAIHDVVLVPTGRLPLTTSGKVRRKRCREIYRSGQFPEKWALQAPSASSAASVPAAPQSPQDPDAQIRLGVICSILGEILNCPVTMIDVRRPITAYALDSLKLVDFVLTVESRLDRFLTVEQLLRAESLVDLCERFDAPHAENPARFLADTALPASLRGAGPVDPSDGAILLTGATGLLGARLLGELINRSDRTIYCLARGSSRDASEKVRLVLDGFGVTATELQRRVRWVAGDIERPQLGIDAEAHAEIASACSLVVHSAATLDFVRPYNALNAANVQAARALIELAGNRRPKRLLQISSTSVLETPIKAGMALSETEPLDYPETLVTGYAQSKWVADVMMERARTRGFSTSIVRLPWLLEERAHGLQSVDGFLSRLFSGCEDIGCLPDLGIGLNIMAAGKAAEGVAAIALSNGPARPVYHIGAEHYLSARDLLEALQSRGGELSLVTPQRWLDRLRQRLRETRQHPLSPLTTLFLDRPGTPARIEPYLNGGLPTVDSGETHRLLSAMIGFEAPSVGDIQQLIVGMMAFRDGSRRDRHERSATP